MTSPTDPNGPSLENIHPPKCTCGAGERRSGTSRHMNKEVPRLHHTDPVDRLIEESKQLHMWAADLVNDIEDLQEGDKTVEPLQIVNLSGEELSRGLQELIELDHPEPKRLSTINDILAVLKLLVQKV